MGLRQMYSERQIEVLRKYKQGFRLMINYGAKRSGKTVIDNDLFLMELRAVRKRADAVKFREPQYILAGVSSKTIEQNILNPLRNKYGIEFKFDKHGNFTLFGVKVVLAYTGSIGGLGAIRGMTAWGAYVNEASLANKYVFKEIMDRCSSDGAKIICDTNPDHPQHWLKVDYLDNDKPEVRTVSTHFTLEDNEAFLGEEYINDQKAMTPSGMMYERDILGLWVSGEGMVYQDFDKKRMLVDEVPKDLHYYAGVDWGFEHKGSIVLFGDDDKGNTYLIEEHTKKHKFIDYWVKIAKDIQKRYGYNVTFFIDGARPDNYNEFLRNGISARNANKARMAGIESVAKLMKLGRFFVLGSAVQSFLDEIYTYIWDDKTGEPVKQNDDVMDAMRYAIYNEHLNNDAQFINSIYI